MTSANNREVMERLEEAIYRGPRVPSIRNTCTGLPTFSHIERSFGVGGRRGVGEKGGKGKGKKERKKERKIGGRREAVKWERRGGVERRREGERRFGG